MKVFNNIREFFWPLLEDEEIPNPTMLNVNDINVDTSHLKETLDYAINCYEAESERKKIVESKSSLFIGTISIVTSVLIGVTTVLVRVNDFNFAVSLLIFLLFILTLYMSRTVWFSIKALERKTYFSISISDFLISDSNDDYFKKLIAEVSNKTRRNYITINNKVDYMTMAQEYFKRAVVIISIYAFVFFLYFISKSEINFLEYIRDFCETLNTIKINGWNTLFLYILSSTAIILSIIAIIRKK